LHRTIDRGGNGVGVAARDDDAARRAGELLDRLALFCVSSSGGVCQSMLTETPYLAEFPGRVFCAGVRGLKDRFD